MALVQGRLALVDGKFAEARDQFSRFLDPKKKSPAMVEFSLGRAEAELSAGALTDAANDAQAALTMARSLQGDVPHSMYTGLSWLMLGRIQQARGRAQQANQSLESAITHLSHTVDESHSGLVLARQKLSSRVVE
jgi:TolA-binding protein